MLVKSSNRIYRPKKGAIVNGVSLLETRYTSEGMQKIYGITIIPIISSSDKLFLKRHLHLCHTYATSESNSRIHKYLSLTLCKAKYGILAITSDQLRIIYRTFLKHCTRCIKSSDKGGEYMPELGNPRIMDLIGVENPLWHRISADIVGPWNVSQFQGARGGTAVSNCMVSSSVT